MGIKGLSLALTGLMFANACAGSSSPDASASPEPPETSVVSSTTAEAATAAEATPTTEVPSDVERYCAIRTEAAAALATFEEGDDSFDPVLLEAFIERAHLDLLEANTYSDPKIARPMAELVESSGLVLEIFEANDYAFFAALEELGTYDNTEFEAANDAVEAYDASVCGILTDDGDPEGADDESEGADDESEGADDESISLEEAQQYVELMKSPAILEAVAQGIVEDKPALSIEEAECLLSSLTAEQFMAFSNTDKLELSDPLLPEFVEQLLACDISLSDYSS